MVEINSEEYEMARLLLQLAVDGGGRVDPQRIAQRSLFAPSRLAFDYCRGKGWIDRDGWVTAIGREELAKS